MYMRSCKGGDVVFRKSRTVMYPYVPRPTVKNIFSDIDVKDPWLANSDNDQDM